MNIRLFIVEYADQGAYDYIVSYEEDMVRMIRSNLDKRYWDILVRYIREYYGISESNLPEDQITYDLIEEACSRYIEDENLGFYCETPITNLP